MEELRLYLEPLSSATKAEPIQELIKYLLYDSRQIPMYYNQIKNVVNGKQVRSR